MRQKYLILLFGFNGVELASGALSFSLQFSNAFGDGVLSGIADEAGDLTSGLSWGILTVSYTHLTLPTTPYV